MHDVGDRRGTRREGEECRRRADRRRAAKNQRADSARPSKRDRLSSARRADCAPGITALEGEADSRTSVDSLRKAAREDAVWAERRAERDRRCERGVRSVWGRSPVMCEIHEIYEEYERAEKVLHKDEQLPKPLDYNASEQSANSRKEKKERKKDKKSNKKRKKKHEKSSESEEEWVEVTAEMREAEAAREKLEEAAMIGPAVPDHLLQKHAALLDTSKRIK
ncbi:unnamed protein product [Gongylonema pulchrum]|uniref:Protein FAM133-like n=1 Tax=Gongylonema pulchrum TaxID=637853 RepID=A0A183E8T9_9BILA|nr:unnamed protein product [Gongylonema pulchrum]